MLICYSALPYVRFGDLHRSGLVPIVALFLLTFAATKAGRQRKIALGVAEDRRGRNAAQVSAKSHTERMALAVAAGQKVFPQYAENAEKAFSIAWTELIW